jgi:hypothetical protein
LKHEITIDAKEEAPSEKPTGCVGVGLMQDSFDGIDLMKPISRKTKRSGPETSFAVCSKS